MSYLKQVVGKNGISVRVVEASISKAGQKLTTLELRYPRYIHSEIMTHREFSRNAASSRAIPVQKFIDQVKNDPAMPIHWGLNQPGMQAQDEEVDPIWAKDWWLRVSEQVLPFAEEAKEANLHKQIANRILEHWQFMNTLVSSTSFDNFFEQRLTPFAQPEFRHLAELMKEALDTTEYTERDLHVPYVTDEERFTEHDVVLEKISAARCCRVSYNRLGESPSIQEDIDRHDSLVASGHWSPFEHVAMALTKADLRSGNFKGWHQYRNVLQGIDPIKVMPVKYEHYS